MTLPDIPDEAIKAVMDAIHRDDAQTVTDALTPAWPHLYAAALRHAADVALPRDRTSRRPMDYRQIQDWLRRLADEAAPVVYMSCACGWKAQGDRDTVAELLAAHARSGCVA